MAPEDQALMAVTFTRVDCVRWPIVLRSVLRRFILKTRIFLPWVCSSMTPVTVAPVRYRGP
jgi:hypothetical protein